MKAEKTTRKVQKTVEVDEETFTLTLSREEADFIARIVGAPSGQESFQMARESIRPLPDGPLTLESVCRITRELYHALDGVL